MSKQDTSLVCKLCGAAVTKRQSVHSDQHHGRICRTHDEAQAILAKQAPVPVPKPVVHSPNPIEKHLDILLSVHARTKWNLNLPIIYLPAFTKRTEEFGVSSPAMINYLGTCCHCGKPGCPEVMLAELPIQATQCDQNRLTNISVTGLDSALRQCLRESGIQVGRILFTLRPKDGNGRSQKLREVLDHQDGFGMFCGECLDALDPVEEVIDLPAVIGVRMLVNFLKAGK